MLGEILAIPELRSSKDSPTVRNIATFLEALADSAPRFMHANRMVVLPLLNCKCYSVRNAVITTLGSICNTLPNTQSGVDCSEQVGGGGGGGSKEGDEEISGSSSSSVVMDKETRDELLDLLLERVHDVSAYCRSRCLKTWGQLCGTGAIPLTKVLPAVLAASDRMADKSAMVRKNALGFLEAIFEHCPFQEEEIAEGLCVACWLVGWLVGRRDV